MIVQSFYFILDYNLNLSVKCVFIQNLTVITFYLKNSIISLITSSIEIK